MSEHKNHSLRQLAREGNLEAITLLINRAVEPKNITAKVDLKDNCLEIIVESAQTPDEKACTTLILRELSLWKTNFIEILKIQGHKNDEVSPIWNKEIEITSQIISQAFINKPSVNSNQIKASPKKSKQQYIQAILSLIDFNNLDHFKAGLIALIAIYGFLGSLDPGFNGPFVWLHFPDLAIHETGHLLFMIVFGAGSFLHILGGSLTQIVFPAAFAIYFFIVGQRYSSAITWFWTGQNFMDVSVYIKDAQARELPLTVDDPDAHDWYNLLSMMGILEHDQAVGNFVYFIGLLILISSIFLGLYFSQNKAKHSVT